LLRRLRGLVKLALIGNAIRQALCDGLETASEVFSFKASPR
jgi:hypothetical protein